ncbi:Retrovirus-related Pol polyprotein like [Argiope bruennichi]|uniref:RNA-directed DNA polymerase n=1 Tax=Argiope bruennichi TaxID=94029 RepID=A0A8T0EZD7_ARGBR|nr:Retrovirus-related Pol polyprotein like [Argiope bruennichi]
MSKGMLLLLLTVARSNHLRLPFDDIVIFSQTWEGHLTHLEDIFHRLSTAKLHIKPSKCRCACYYVKYLGHSFGQGQRTPGELKVQAMKDFLTPTNKPQIRAFMGLAGCYRKYIPEFSVISTPLTNLLKGRCRKSIIEWNSSCQKAFEELKEKLSKYPVLYSPNFSKQFIIQCDASNLGIEVVLTQVSDNDGEHPIMYLSKKFSSAEQKYSTTERECVAIIYVVQKLKCYLDGKQKFVIQTDHNPLVWLEKNSGTIPRLLRWALILQSFNYEIVRKGKQHQDADSLSRIP